MSTPRLLALCSLFLLLFSCNQQEEIQNLYPEKRITMAPDSAATLAGKLRQEVAVDVADGLDLSLWAVDSLVSDPIAISIDPEGRIFYTRASRQGNSEFDIRGHRNWMTASISFQTMEDRRAFLRKTFSEDSEESQQFLNDLNEDGVLDWRDLAVEKEEVWFVVDSTGDGVADRAQLYLEDFNEEITDVANGVEFHDGEVFITCAPNMWRTKDRNHDGIADQKDSISTGFMVHIGFSGHGMSGAKIGPDGRIWWGIGDIGMNVVDQDGKRWKYPNQGVIVRSELDGSGFEVYSHGVRNTHEFVFDKYGNLITEDNDGDHRGERERLVHLINGSDSGWRTNWQFGKYTDPKNNEYKVWMDERLHVPRWEGQAAYILPPITNYVNGPTGMVYNPGTALGPEWYDHFFIAEFRGTPANSPVHAFTLEPKGASFELASTQEVVKGVLPTGLDFGPDGALYFSDWITGWGLKDAGRIWKLDVPGGAGAAIRQETKELLQADFSKSSEAELGELLAHQDMRVRQKAQFELVKRGEPGHETLLNTAKTSGDQLARIHALWGLGQLSRQDEKYAADFLPFLEDDDTEIAAQSIRMLGDIRYADAGDEILPFVQHESPRVRLLATEALGRMAFPDAHGPVVEMLRDNNDEDAWLRHAGAIALARIGKESELAALHSDPSRAVRTAAVVALRRMSSPEVAVFLKDEDPYVVTEAARAINDDFSIEEAFPALAEVLEEERFTEEPLLRRAINANLRIGEQENAERLAAYAQRPSAPPAMRAEALAALSTWASPSVFDRVDGRYRGEVTRDAALVAELLEPILEDLMKDQAPDLQIAAAQATARLEMKDAAPTLMGLIKNDADPEVRKAALQALYEMEADNLAEALQVAIADQNNEVRSTALSILPESEIAEGDAVQLFQRVIQTGSIQEQQAAFTALGAYQGTEAVATLDEALNKLALDQQPPAVQLDIIEAVEEQKNPDLMKKLDAYQAAKPADDVVAQYREALVGGNGRQGWQIFNNNEAAQCVRCHAIFERGGNAGPGLAGVGDRLSREEILESLVAPSAVLAPGYGVAVLEMQDGETVSGIVLEETDSSIRLKIGKEDIRTVEKEKIAKREDIPSSMPPMGSLLSKRQIRDLVAFLSNLKEENM